MRPIDAKPADWFMYFHGTWMEHDTLGPCKIRVEGPHIYVKHARVYTEVHPSTLSPWWPRASSMNGPNGGFYIAKRAQRNMRKSGMAGHHYYCSYGSTPPGDIMQWFTKENSLISLEDACDRLLDTSNTSPPVAIHRDLILDRGGKGNALKVIFRGNYAGSLEGQMFTPIADGHPMSKRAAIKLHSIGLF